MSLWMHVLVRAVQHASCPTAVIHGVVDEVVPFHHGVQMHAALPRSQTYPPLWIKRGSHVSSGLRDTILDVVSDLPPYPFI